MSKGSDAGASPIDLAAEKAALAWLDGFDSYIVGREKEHVRTLKALLAEPRLPAEPSEEIVGALLKVLPLNFFEPRRVYRALYAELTAPKTKTVWYLFHASDGDCGGENFDTPSAAYQAAWPLIRVGHKVTIEGREVPA